VRISGRLVLVALAIAALVAGIGAGAALAWPDVPNPGPTSIVKDGWPWVSSSAVTGEEKADLVLTNGVVYTVDEDRTSAEAVAIRGDTIVFVGSSTDAADWIGDGTKVIDLAGRLVLPGLIDSHAHATSGVSDLYEVPLYGIGSVEEYQQTIADFIAARPGLVALQGGGWINSVFGEHGPTVAMLDAVCADIPAALYSEDYHSVWVNSKTLELAGVTAATADPEGGVIERDADGNPSGTLRESAVDLITDVIPAYTTEKLVEGLTYFQDFAHSLGLTTVYIPSLPSGDAAGLQALHDFDASGAMAIRFPTAMNVEPTDDVSIVDKIVAARTAEKGGLYEIVAAKIFMDGVLEGMTAYLEEPYDIRPDYRGELLWDPQAYNRMCAALDKAGSRSTSTPSATPPRARRSTRSPTRARPTASATGGRASPTSSWWPPGTSPASPSWVSWPSRIRTGSSRTTTTRTCRCPIWGSSALTTSTR